MSNEGMMDKNIQEEIARARKNFARVEAAEPRADSVRYDREINKVVVDLRNGATFMFPPELAQGLTGATTEELEDIQLTPAADGIHWLKLDVFLSIPLLMKGIFGSRAWMASIGRKGGSSTSEAKALAARENGKKGGRPAKTKSESKRQAVSSRPLSVFMDTNLLYESFRDYYQKWADYECPNSYVVLLCHSGAGKSTWLNRLDWGRAGAGKRKLFFIDQLDELDDFDYFKEFFAVYARSLEDNLNDVEPLLRAHEAMHYQLIFTSRKWIDKVQSFDAWDSAQSGKLLIKSSLTWNAVVNLLVKRLRRYDLVAKCPQFTEKLLEPYFNFSNFAARTLERMEVVTAEEESNALAASILLAEQQIKGSTCLLGAAIESHGAPSVEGEGSVPVMSDPFGFFEAQQKELVAAGTMPITAEYSLLAGLSQSASVAERSIRCLACAYKYSELTKEGGKGHGPKVKTLEAFAHLPWVVARDGRAFGTYVTLLWALFEWAGLGSEMSIDENLFPTYKYKPIRTLKFLRDAFVHQGLWSTESPQASRPSPQVSEALDTLGFSSMPESPDRYTRLQQNLLDELEPFLESMYRQVEQYPPVTAEGGRDE